MRDENRTKPSCWALSGRIALDRALIARVARYNIEMSSPTIRDRSERPALASWCGRMVAANTTATSCHSSCILRHMHQERLEGLAVTTHRKHRIAMPVDAFQMADCEDLLLTPVSPSGESFDGREIKFGRAPHRDQQAFVALCIARYLLLLAGFYPDQITVHKFARALMLPWEQFLSDLRGRRSLDELRVLHPHVPTQWICARIGDVYNRSMQDSSVSPRALGAASRLLALGSR